IADIGMMCLKIRQRHKAKYLSIILCFFVPFFVDLQCTILRREKFYALEAFIYKDSRVSKKVACKIA
ncbi:MAG TPA: hypothetical protein PK457_00840, partial [Methylotenera sp.]|nr:hypothetical protein [Methylotenera sp.]